MKKTFILSMICSVIVSLLFFSPITSHACSCIAPRTVEEEFKNTKAVFSGKVIRVEENQPSVDNLYPVKVIFEVQNTWKGIDESEVAVYTGTNSASCGYNFNVGNTYLVYANQTEEQYTTSICSITKPLSDANEDLSVLTEGKKPTKITKVPEGGNTTLTWIVLACLLVGAVSYSVARVMRKD